MRIRRLKKRTKKERISSGRKKSLPENALAHGAQRGVEKNTIESTEKETSHTTSSIKQKGQRGRKSKYNKDFPLFAQGFAREGLNDKEIALKLGITVSTYYEYKKDYPDFSEAIKKGKAPVDIKVENAMLRRCLGFKVEEVSVEYDPAQKEEENPIVTKVIKKTKEIIPHFGSGAFWLTNRKPETWKNRHKIDATVQVKPLSMEDMLKSEAASE